MTPGEVRHLSAPGKLFLAGEYAVVWGGQAWVLAVGPRVGVAVRRREDRQVHLLLSVGRLHGPATPAGVSWESEVPEGFRFVARAVDLALQVHGQEGLGFEVAMGPSPLHRGLKLGLGSSARATVLAAGAARWALGARFDELKLALLAHASAQGGKGSGGDVAACALGGLVRYRRWETAGLLSPEGRARLGSLLEASPPVEASRGPRLGFPVLYVFSGQAASTPGLLAHAERELREAGRRAFVEASDRAGEVLEQGLVRGDFGQVREAMGALQELLWRLPGTRHEGLTQILRLAATCGCAGKQSGAGGGDGAVLLAPDVEARSEAARALSARGYLCLEAAGEPGLGGEA